MQATNGRNRLLHLRAERDLTQQQLAAEAGISAKTIHRIENGQRPNLRTAYKLARVLDISVDELFEATA